MEVDKWKERDRLFRLSIDELKQQPTSVQYDRMRYEREIEGCEFVKLLNSGVDRKIASVKAREKADEAVRTLKL